MRDLIFTKEERNMEDDTSITSDLEAIKAKVYKLMKEYISKNKYEEFVVNLRNAIKESNLFLVETGWTSTYEGVVQQLIIADSESHQFSISVHYIDGNYECVIN